MTDRTPANAVIARVLLLTAVILLVISRRPELFTAPRFWAEEGADYFAHAWNQGFLEALFAQHFGYYAIVPTLATAFASLGPLEYATLVTTLIAALFQVLVSAIVIFGDSPFWDSWPKRILLAFGIQLLNPYEAWLTTIGTQYWLTIALFLILLERRESAGRLQRFFHRGMVLIGGLSGGQPLFLVPAYALRAWRSKNREDMILATILAGTGLLQAAAFISAKTGNDPYMQTRFGGINFDLFQVISHHLINPFISAAFFDLPSIIAMDNASAGFLYRFLPNSISYPSILSALILVAGTSVYILYLNRRSYFHQYLACAYIFVVFFSTLLSLQMASSARYAFAPSITMLTLFTGALDFHRPFTVAKMLALFLLVVISLSAIHDIRTPVRIYFGSDLPVWRNEVASWRSDPSHRLLIWPPYMNKRWDFMLEKKDNK